MLFSESGATNGKELSITRQLWHKWIAFALLWIPSFMLFIVLILESHSSFREFLEDYLVSLVIAETVMTVCLCGSYFISFLEAWLCEVRGIPYIETSTPFHILRSMIFIFPGMYLAFHLCEWLAPYIGIKFSAPSWQGYRPGILISCLSCFAFAAFDLFFTKRRQDKRLASLESENLQSKVKALSAQMNPHLMFNALNSVAATIKDDPHAAEDMTVELAGLYRKILKAAKTDVHSLAEELEICVSYLKVEKSRFGPRLDFEISAPEDSKEIEVPSLLIQPLVENAVTHGLSPKPDGGMITIEAELSGDSLALHVIDTGVGFGRSDIKGTRTALENCRKRLELRYGSQCRLQIHPVSSGAHVEMTIPI